jgi:D-alanyl-D-alanine carboxypeptidase
MRWLMAISPGLLGLALSCAAQAQSLQATLDRIVRQDRLPGAVLLVSGPRGRQLVASGRAAMRPDMPMRTDSRFYIASSGKLVTTSAILQLIAEGRIALGDRIYATVKVIPNIERLANVREVTLAQLLSHRSGMAEYYDERFTRAADRHKGRTFSADESLGFAFGEDAEDRPDKAYSYNNTNFVLLGRIIELLDRSSYGQSVKRRIFDRVGMGASGVGARRGGPNLAHAYVRDGDGPWRDVSHGGWNSITGDGAIITTAADYEAFLFALFRDGGLVPARELRVALSAAPGNKEAGYGHGVEIAATQWGPIWGHSGYIPGFTAETWYAPRLKTALVFMTNGDRARDSDVVSQILRTYLRD